MNIVIVGGGTAGWIAAYLLSESKPQYKITLIESDSIGIIGAGEGATGQMVRLLLGGINGFVPRSLDLDDFIKNTDATNKMGIRFKNWSGNDSNYFVPVATSITANRDNDYILKYVFSKYGSDNIHLSSIDGIKYENKKYDDFLALHFDAHKVGNYFKNKTNNVKQINAIVVDTKIDEFGNINKIILDNGSEILGDFFIDCSGFKKVLINKLNVKWISCKQYLPVDTAMPFIVKYKENEKIIPETGTTAMSSGWMWDIPLQTRRGCGYVFDSNFISKEDAKKEIEKHLGQEIEPIKFINFDSGYLDTFWKNNVLALGLSSSFFEPLQATSIHNTIMQMSYFLNNFLFDNIKDTINVSNMNKYNDYINSIMTSSLNLISLTYQGKRYDTDFWRYIVDNNIVTDQVKEYIETSKHKMITPDMIPQPDGGHNFGLISQNLIGLGLVEKSLARKELDDVNLYDFAEKEYQKYYRAYSYKKI